jgi:predicted transcriptional regulator
MRYSLGMTMFNMNVILRILDTLYEEGKMNRTNLANRTRLNYGKCIKYVNLLALLGWIKIILDETHYLAITDKGFEIMNKFSALH